MQTTSITVDPAVARQIKEQALEGFRALPKRGIEVGGVLLGRVLSDDPLAVRVDGFESAPCEHRFGPSFALSEQDRAGLEEILARRRSEVVGYFRSCTGRELALDASDEELIDAHFRDSGQVCLCVAPVSARDCVATVFSWRNGLPPRQVEPVFLFDALSVETPEPVKPPSHPEPPALLPAPPPPARDHRAWPWIFVLVLAIGCAFLYERWQSARAEWPSRLGLDIQQTNEGVELRWDASSPAVRNAGRGLLSITLDGSENEIELDAATVHSGTFPYRASGKDVLFRLTVYGPEMRAATESFRMVAVAPPAPAPLEEAKAQEPEPEPPQPEEPAPKPEPAVAAVPPVAIHEVQPGISDGIRARIEKPVVVPVDVQINALGRVASAVPQSGGDALYRYLAERAVGAARAWRFQPARSKNGTPVPSSKTLYFVFRS